MENYQKDVSNAIRDFLGYGNETIVGALVRSGADIYIKDNQGFYPLKSEMKDIIIQNLRK